MSDPNHDNETPRDEKDSGAESTSEGGTSGGATGAKPRQAPAKSPKKPLSQWRVILHNDDVNSFEDVIESIVMITPLGQSEAMLKTKLAHESGSALLLTTHRERAELYVQQLGSRHLTATAEPDA